jgi:hypothetical protein
MSIGWHVNFQAKDPVKDEMLFSTILMARGHRIRSGYIASNGDCETGRFFRFDIVGEIRNAPPQITANPVSGKQGPWF